MINYNWDMYEWIWKEPRGYNWPEYGELLNKSVENWCPSEEVKLRAEEFFKCGSNHKVIKSYARLFEADVENVKDGRYIYNPIRDLPGDRNFGWLDRVANKHNLPVYKSLHKLSEEEFQKKIMECSFMVCELYEASTGGLTLLEGYHYGKPCLVCDSEYMGAKDYFGDRAYYYKHDSFEDFERVVLELWNNTPKLDISKCRELTNQYTLDRMVRQMYNRLEKLSE
jgi:glycosyltransferase involved in cell wall biosynthesis